MKNEIAKDRKSEALEFIRFHFDKLSQREIARRLFIGKTTVNRWSKEVGLFFKKHTANEHYFDTLTEQSAYILGFIFADGNVAYDPENGYYSMTITASEKDAAHLEKMRKLLSSTKPLLYSPSTKSNRLIVNSKKLCQKLIAYGVVPRKSLIVEFPIIPKEYVNHFLRGIIDGDGNVRFVKRKRSPYFEITIASGSLTFCQGIVSTIEEHIGITTRIRKAGQHTHILQYSCSRGEKLANFIYSDATLFLKRKHIHFLDKTNWRQEHG